MNFVKVNAKTVGEYQTKVANGRKHLVVSAMAIEGDSVMNRLFYPSSVVTANYSKLKGVLAPLSHPIIDGEHVSASNPMAINAYGIGGFVKAPRLNDKQVVAEIWIDEATAETTTQGRRTLNAIKNGEKIGVSTGLFVDAEPAEGQTEYDQVVTNFDVDHLAILLDEQPAGKNTYIQNDEDQTVDLKLLINSLIAVGALDESKTEEYLQLNEKQLAEQLKPVKTEELALNSEEIKLFAANKEVITNHLESIEAEKAELIKSVAEKSGLSVNTLQTMDFSEVKKLMESLSVKKTTNNSARNPEPSGSEQTFELREGS